MAVIPTDPSTGEATKTSWAVAVDDALADHESRIGTLEGAGLANGSFEVLDGSSSPEPSGWTMVDSSATHASEDTEVVHGLLSLKHAVTGTDGYSRATLEADVPCGYGQRIEVTGFIKASGASIPAQVRILWWQLNGSASAVRASDTLYTTASAPTSWTQWAGQAVCPSDAVTYTVEVTGGGTGSANGNVIYWDGIESRVFHGFVQISSTADLGTGTITLTTSHFTAGERPRKARVVVAYTLDPFATGSGTYTLTGNSKTVWTETGSSSIFHLMEAVVELNESFQFSSSVGGNAIAATYLVGYEV